MVYPDFISSYVREYGIMMSLLIVVLFLVMLMMMMMMMITTYCDELVSLVDQRRGWLKPSESDSRPKFSEAYSEPSQTSKIEHFAKVIYGFEPLTFLAESSILDVWLGSECVSAFGINMNMLCAELIPDR